MLFPYISKRAFCISKSKICTTFTSIWWSQTTISIFKVLLHFHFIVIFICVDVFWLWKK